MRGENPFSHVRHNRLWHDSMAPICSLPSSTSAAIFGYWPSSSWGRVDVDLRTETLPGHQADVGDWHATNYVQLAQAAKTKWKSRTATSQQRFSSDKCLPFFLSQEGAREERAKARCQRPDSDTSQPQSIGTCLLKWLQGNLIHWIHLSSRLTAMYEHRRLTANLRMI